MFTTLKITRLTEFEKYCMVCMIAHRAYAQDTIAAIYDRDQSSVTSVLSGVDGCFDMMPFLQVQWRKVVTQLNVVENLEVSGI